jgi:citrate synthase
MKNSPQDSKHDLTFTTSVSGHTSAGLELRGHQLSELISQADFVSTLFLSITGREPTSAEKTVFNAILVASIDHGIEPASGFVPRVVAASGNEVKTAMASTLLALGNYHGGAITAAMRTMQSLADQTGDLEQACQDLVDRYRAEKKRVMGYGHPAYTDQDPRTQQLFSLAQAQKLSPQFTNLALMLEETIERTLNKKLVLNVDGAIAALLLTMKFDPEAGNAVFALARTAGSIAHILEELKEKPVRRLPSGSVTYQPS